MFNRTLVSRYLVHFTYHLHLNFSLGELQQHFYGIFRLMFSIRRIDLENLKSDTNERDFKIFSAVDSFHQNRILLLQKNDLY